MSSPASRLPDAPLPEAPLPGSPLPGALPPDRYPLAIIGAGALGLHFAARLAEVMPVAVIARDDARAARLRAGAVLPFHRKIVREPAFTYSPFRVYTRWIETEFDNDIEPWSGSLPDGSAPPARHNVVVEVGGKRVEVSLPTKLVPTAGGGPALAAAPRRSAAASVSTVTGDTVKAPMRRPW